MIGLILAAAGSGCRFGSAIPKQFTSLQGRALYLHALEPFAAFVSQVSVVVPETWIERVGKHLQSLSYAHKLMVQIGGPQRQDSVYEGLKRLSHSTKIVLVHDAVRPLVSASLIRRVIQGTQLNRACIPVLPIPETVKEVLDEQVVATLERQRLRLVQTPQGFEINLLRRALEEARQDGFYATDESSLVERIGQNVFVVAGDPANRKITWKTDFERI